jgi:hypothetical protein
VTVGVTLGVGVFVGVTLGVGVGFKPSLTGVGLGKCFIIIEVSPPLTLKIP